MRLTSCLPALDMLTLPLVSLSKPVGPFNEVANSEGFPSLGVPVEYMDVAITVVIAIPQ